MTEYAPIHTADAVQILLDDVEHLRPGVWIYFQIPFARKETYQGYITDIEPVEGAYHRVTLVPFGEAPTEMDSALVQRMLKQHERHKIVEIFKRGPEYVLRLSGVDCLRTPHRQKIEATLTARWGYTDSELTAMWNLCLERWKRQQNFKNSLDDHAAIKLKEDTETAKE